MSNFILPGTALVVVFVLYLPSLRKSPFWRATITPLASIIGSGFLISGPLLTHIMGMWAPLAMLCILLIAYAIGGIIRFNIAHSEGLIGWSEGQKTQTTLQRISDLALGFAYIVSVAFYVHLLASFIMRFGNYRDEVIENLLTTAVLLSIVIVGWFRGLTGLEKLEETAVSIKLAIIGALLLGLTGFDGSWLAAGGPLIEPDLILSPQDRLRSLAGLLLIVQGFETSRYLGKAYDRRTRVRSMKLAQAFAGAIYMFFIILGLPLLLEFHGNADETTIIALAGRVATILPAMIVVAAAMSQLSAAIADTAGAGGLFSELSGGAMSSRHGYIGLIITAVLLVWTANIFEIITLASRLFALYYLLQCLVALIVCSKTESGGTMKHYVKLAGFSCMALFLIFVVLFAIPVG